MKRSKIDGHLPIFQRKAIIKLLVKTKILSLLLLKYYFFDTKILSKSLVEKLKHALPEIISSNQIPYVKNQKELCQFFSMVIPFTFENNFKKKKKNTKKKFFSKSNIYSLPLEHKVDN